MKLKCNDNRRVMVLSSGRIIHRNDGSLCKRDISIGGNKVDKLYAPETGDFVTLGISRPEPGERLLKAIFEGGAK